MVGRSSYAATLSQLVNGTSPDKGVGVTLTIPIRNRQAQADQVRAELEYRQAQVRLQQLGNQVRIEVRNAQFALQQNRASVQAAQAAVDFARQTLDAEQQKLAVGVSNPTAVLQDQSGLTTAESNLVSAKAAYEKARVELDRATGLLLDHSGIVMADAERGEVTHMPNVPYVAPRQDVATGRGLATAAAGLLSGRFGPARLAFTRQGRMVSTFSLPELRCILPRVTLSVVLITQNEEGNLPRTLESVMPLVRDGKGEIIVVDSGSTDRTVEIAQSFGAKIFVEAWKGFAAQKNSAMDKASMDWVLQLDADERLEPELASRNRDCAER